MLALNAIARILVRQRQREFKDRHRGESNVKTGQKDMQPQAKECGHSQKLEEARHTFSLRASRGSVALPTPKFQISGLQNCQRIE